MGINFISWHWSGIGLLEDERMKACLERAKNKGYREGFVSFKVVFASYPEILSRIVVLYNSASYPVIAYHLVGKAVFELFGEVSWAFLMKDFGKENLEQSSVISRHYKIKLTGDYQKDYEKIKEAIIKSRLNLIWHLNQI